MSRFSRRTLFKGLLGATAAAVAPQIITPPSLAAVVEELENDTRFVIHVNRTLRSPSGQAYDLGKAFADGLAEGIATASGAVEEAAASLIDRHVFLAGDMVSLDRGTGLYRVARAGDTPLGVVVEGGENPRICVDTEKRLYIGGYNSKANVMDDIVSRVPEAQREFVARQLILAGSKNAAREQMGAFDPKPPGTYPSSGFDLFDHMRVRGLRYEVESS